MFLIKKNWPICLVLANRCSLRGIKRSETFCRASQTKVPRLQLKPVPNSLLWNISETQTSGSSRCVRTRNPTCKHASPQNKPGTRTPPQPAGSQDVAVSVVTSERTRLPHRKNPRRRNPAFGHQTSDGPLRDRQAACSCKSMFF